MRHHLCLLILCLPLPLCAAALRTPDGLVLELADDGQVAGLSLRGRPLPVTPGGGFTVRDVAAGSTRQPLRCPLLPDGGVIIQQQQFDGLGLTLETSCAAAGEYLSFSAKLTDHTGRDRAIEASFEVPLDAGGWSWADDLDHSRRLEGGEPFRSTMPCGAGPGYCQLLPISCLSKGEAGLTVGVPLSQGPRIYAVEYDPARKVLAIRFHLGLSPQVKKLPQQAWFSFLIYAHDGAWGLRSALAKYYRLFPQDFTRRGETQAYLGAVPAEAFDGTRTPAALYGVPALGDFGGVLYSAGRVAGTATDLPARLDELAAREPQREPFAWALDMDGGDPARPPDATPEALCGSEAPLTYLHKTRAVASVEGQWRTQAKEVAPLAWQRQLLLSRQFAGATPGLCGEWPLFDLGVLDAATPAAGDWLFRAAAGTRRLRFRGDTPEQARGAAPLRAMLSRGLLHAIYPNLQADALRQRDLYLQFVPVIERLSAAGWEPVTLARSAASDLQIERYGSVGARSLCFAVRNGGTLPVETTLVLDPALGLPAKPAAVHVVDLIADEALAATATPAGLAVPVKLEPGAATALMVLSREGYLRRMLSDAADLLAQATPLTPEEISLQPSRPGELRAGDSPPGAEAATILRDGWKTDQGLIFGPGEPLTISLDVNAPHRLQWVRVTCGTGEGYAAPEAVLEAADREGMWHKLGALSPVGQAARLPGAGEPPALLATITDTAEYQRLRLVTPELKQKLWLKEIEIGGRDGALMRASERFRALAEAGRADFGVIGQLAMVLRVRRMVGHDRTLQERALTALADYCSLTSGITVRVEVPNDAPASGLVQAQVAVRNQGSRALREGSIKLKLPPGWSAAPGKFEVALEPGQTVRLPVTLNRPPEGGRLTVLITGVVDGVPLFMSRQE